MAIPVVEGANVGSGYSIAIPEHNAGDLIIVHAVSLFTYPSVPSASGTVPTWNTLSDANNGSWYSRVAYSVATASDTTTGTWTYNDRMIVSVVSGHKETDFVGANSRTVGNANGVSTGVYAPALTLAQNDGSSLVLRSIVASTLSGVLTVATGHTAAINTRVTNICVGAYTKNDTTSAPAASFTANEPGNYAAVSIEILAPSGGGNGFFSMF